MQNFENMASHCRNSGRGGHSHFNPYAMNKIITIYCKNNGQRYDVPTGSTLEEVYNLTGFDMPYGVTSAKVNNKVEGLHFMCFTDKDVEFLDVTSPSGMRT